MSNPWLKKNPFMSAWLSGVNAAVGATRGKAMAVAKRHVTRAAKSATSDFFTFWAGGLPAKKPGKKTRRR